MWIAVHRAVCDTENCVGRSQVVVFSYRDNLAVPSKIKKFCSLKVKTPQLKLFKQVGPLLLMPCLTNNHIIVVKQILMTLKPKALKMMVLCVRYFICAIEFIFYSILISCHKLRLENAWLEKRVLI